MAGAPRRRDRRPRPRPAGWCRTARARTPRAAAASAATAGRPRAPMQRRSDRTPCIVEPWSLDLHPPSFVAADFDLRSAGAPRLPLCLLAERFELSRRAQTGQARASGACSTKLPAARPRAGRRDLGTGFRFAGCARSRRRGLRRWLAARRCRARRTELDVTITYVTQDEDRVIPLSLLDTLLPDEGLMGARQAITENQTTGRFLGHDYQLAEVVVPGGRRSRRGVQGRARRRPAAVHPRPPRRADPGARRSAGGGGRGPVQHPRAGRPAAPGRLPGEPVPRHAEPRDEGRRARPVPGLEAVARLVPDPRHARARPRLRRGDRARGHQVRRQDRRDAGLRVRRDRPAHRQRPRPDPDARSRCSPRTRPSTTW